MWTSSVKNTAPSNTFFRNARTKAPPLGAFVVFGTWLFWSPGATAANNECAADHVDEKASIHQVYDGDTVELEDGRKVRFIAVNTPERARHQEQFVAEPYSEDAYAAVTKLLPKHAIVLLRFEEKKTDRYDRVLAHVFTEKGVNVESELLKSGLAAHITFPPNLWQAECYSELQRIAQIAGKGMWSNERYQAIAIDKLAPDSRGFYKISVDIATITTIDRDMFLLNRNGIGFRIDSEDKKYFAQVNFAQWENHTLVGQGWIYRAKNGWMMRIRHPLMFTLATHPQ